MQHSPRIRLSAAERRRSIEAAATRLFAERGYAATTVEEIVQDAGVTKPMLYRHFESKQDLCIALLQSIRADLIAAPLQRFDPDAGASQLVPMLDAWLQHVERNPDATRLLFTPITGDPEVERVQRELYERQRDTQVALLAELAPTLARTAAEPVGEALRAALGAVALWWLDHPGVPRDVPHAALVRLARGAVGSSNERAGDDDA